MNNYYDHLRMGKEYVKRTCPLLLRCAETDKITADYLHLIALAWAAGREQADTDAWIESLRGKA